MVIFAKKRDGINSFSTDKSYLKLMAKISSKNGTKAFNYIRNIKNVLSISRLVAFVSGVVSF